MTASWAVALILLVGGAAAPPRPGPPTLVQERGVAEAADRISAGVALDAGDVPLSGTLRLTFTVEGRAPLRVMLPTMPLSPASAVLWKVREVGPPAVTELPGKRERWRQVFRLLPYAAGDAVPVAPAAFSVRAGEAAADTRFEWDNPLPVRVTTDVVQPDAAELRPPTDIEAAPPAPPSDGAGPLTVLGAVMALAAVAAAIRWARRRSRRAPALDGYQRALRDLAAVRDRADDDPRAIGRLADIVRRYLEFRFEVPATRLTTQELLATLRHGDRLTGEPLLVLQSVLEAGDLAKFSAPEPSDSAAAFARLYDAVRSIIERTAPSTGQAGQPAQPEAPPR